MDEQTKKAFDYFKREGFLPLDKESFSLYKSFEGDSKINDLSATILCAWSNAFSIHYKVIQNHLCSVYSFGNTPVFFSVHLPKCAEQGSLQKVIDTLSKIALQAGLSFLQIASIEESALPAFKSIEGYNINDEYNDDHSEYAYRVGDLLELSGEINYYKRKRIKKFLSDTNIVFESMTKKNIHLCSGIEDIWCKNQDCAYCESFTGCEKKAMEIMADIFDENIHTGLFCYYDNKPVGYAVGEKRNETISFLYFGKAVIPDLFVYIIYKFAQILPHKNCFMNFHEDMGNKGLRQFKASLCPHELWKKYSCTYIRKG